MVESEGLQDSTGLAAYMSLLSCKDELSEVNTIVKFLQNSANMLKVIHLHGHQCIFKYLKVLLQNDFTYQCKSESFHDEEVIDPFKRKNLRKEIIALLVVMEFQTILESCYQTVYSTILEELESVLFSSQCKMIKNMVIKLQVCLQTFMHCSFLDCNGLFLALKLFLSKLLEKFVHIKLSNYKEEYATQGFIMDIVILHSGCPNVHSLIYRDISVLLQKVQSQSKETFLDQYETPLGLVIMLNTFLSIALQKNFDKESEIINELLTLETILKQFNTKKSIHLDMEIKKTVFLLNSFVNIE